MINKAQKISFRAMSVLYAIIKKSQHFLDDCQYPVSNNILNGSRNEINIKNKYKIKIGVHFFRLVSFNL